MPSSGRVGADGTCRAGAAMPVTVPTMDLEFRGFCIFLPKIHSARESRGIQRAPASAGRAVILGSYLTTLSQSPPGLRVPWIRDDDPARGRRPGNLPLPRP